MPACGPHQIVDTVAVGAPIYPSALGMIALAAPMSPGSLMSAGAASNWKAWRLSAVWFEKLLSLIHRNGCFDVKVCTRSPPRHAVVPFTKAYSPILSGSQSLASAADAVLVAGLPILSAPQLADAVGVADTSVGHDETFELATAILAE